MGRDDLDDHPSTDKQKQLAKQGFISAKQASGEGS
jgi:hypothetical protein